MAEKKDKAVVAVISGLTDAQSAKLTADIMKCKSRIAPDSRGTIAAGFSKSIGSFLSEGVKKIGG